MSSAPAHGHESDADEVIGRVVIATARLALRHWYVAGPLLVLALFGIPAGLVAAVLAAVGFAMLARRKQLSRRARAAAVGGEFNLREIDRLMAVWPAVARHAGLATPRGPGGRLSIAERLSAWMRGTADDGLIAPPVRSIRHGALGLEMMLTVLPGQTLATYVRATDILADLWRVTTVRASRHAPGVALLQLVTRDPLADALPRGRRDASDPSSLRSVAVGVTESGSEWALPLDQNHLVVGGVPGSGKSVFLNVLIAAVAERPDTQIVGIDAGGGVELAGWEPRLSALACSQEEGAQLLQAVWEEHASRAAWLRQRGLKSMSSHGYSASCPFLLVVVDEAAQLFALDGTGIEKRLGQDAVSLMTKLVTMGRKTGICVVLATQKPTVNAIPSIIRDNCSQKVAFRLLTAEAVTAVLGDAGRGADVSPVAIPSESPGIAVAAGVDGLLTRCRSFEMSEEDVVSLASRTAWRMRPLDGSTTAHAFS